MSELDTSTIQDTTDDVPRILIVDDNPDNSLLLSAGLETLGYLIESVEAGASAIEYIYATPPDLVLLDVMMPGMSGIDVVKHIKNDASLPFIPIVLVTALDTTNDIVDGLDAGADDYIVKPINFRELNARVKSLLRIKALQRLLARQEQELAQVYDRLRTMEHTNAYAKDRRN